MVALRWVALASTGDLRIPVLVHPERVVRPEPDVALEEGIQAVPVARADRLQDLPDDGRGRPGPERVVPGLLEGHVFDRDELVAAIGLRLVDERLRVERV